MVKSGLLERKQHERDRRAHRIRLKPKGRKIYKKVRDVALVAMPGGCWRPGDAGDDVPEEVTG